MAGTKISEATLRETLKGTESLPIVDNDLPVGRTTVNDIKAFVKNDMPTGKYVVDIQKWGHGGATDLAPSGLPGNGDYLYVKYSDGTGTWISYTDLLHFSKGMAKSSSNDSELSVHVPSSERHLQSATTGLTTKEIDTQIYTFNATSQSTVTLSPKSIQNKYYKWDDKVTALNITLDEDTLDETGNMLLEYMFEFTSGATPTALTITPEPNWIGDHTVEANKTYQVSIVNGIGVMVGFDTPVEAEAEEVNL